MFHLLKLITKIKTFSIIFYLIEYDCTWREKKECVVLCPESSGHWEFHTVDAHRRAPFKPWIHKRFHKYDFMLYKICLFSSSSDMSNIIPFLTKLYTWHIAVKPVLCSQQLPNPDLSTARRRWMINPSRQDVTTARAVESFTPLHLMPFIELWDVRLTCSWKNQMKAEGL